VIHSDTNKSTCKISDCGYFKYIALIIFKNGEIFGKSLRQTNVEARLWWW